MGADVQRVSWAETRQRLRADRNRLVAYLGHVPGRWPRLISLHPSWHAVVLFRLAVYCWGRGWGLAARLIAQFNVLWTGFDSGYASDIGGGFLLIHPVGNTLGGRAGRGFTLMPLSGIGMLPVARDVGAGPGLPWLGDDVAIGAMSGVLGACRLGDRVTVALGCPALRDVADDQDVRPATAPAPAAPDPDDCPDAESARVVASPCRHARWIETWHDLRSDLRRLSAIDADQRGVADSRWRKLGIATTLPFLVAGVHRLAHAFEVRGWRTAAALTALANQLLFRAAIAPASCIGGGWLLAHPVCAVVAAGLGPEATLRARVACAPQDDIWTGPPARRPRIGARVVLSGHGGVFGAVEVGDDCSLQLATDLDRDLASDMTAASGLLRTRSTAAARAASWAPPRPVSPRLPGGQRGALLGATRARLRADRERLQALIARAPSPRAAWLFLLPARIASWTHRWAHFHHRLGHMLRARCYWQLGLWLSGGDLSPDADIGPGLLVPHPAGVSLHCRAGRNLTVLALVTVDGGLGDLPERIAPGGYPTIGDDVRLGHHSGLHGPIRVGDGATLSPGCLLDRDVPAATHLRGRRVRTMTRARPAAPEQATS